MIKSRKKQALAYPQVPWAPAIGSLSSKSATIVGFFGGMVLSRLTIGF